MINLDEPRSLLIEILPLIISKGIIMIVKHRFYERINDLFNN